MENFTLACNTFGPVVTYTAKDLATATSMAKAWCRYHSFHFESEYTVITGTVSEPTSNQNFMELFR
jgi:hypothetical protein